MSPPPLERLRPTKAGRSLPPLPIPPPTDVHQFEEPASYGAGGRAGRDRPTRRRGATCSLPAVPMEKEGSCSLPVKPMEREGSGPRPARPSGGSPPAAGDLGWKATRESPRRPRGGDRRSPSAWCGGAMASRGRRNDTIWKFCFSTNLYIRRRSGARISARIPILVQGRIAGVLEAKNLGFHWNFWSETLREGN
jgi:hypothetical protein